jgi:hypothetical protein
MKYGEGWKEAVHSLLETLFCCLYRVDSESTEGLNQTPDYICGHRKYGPYNALLKNIFSTTPI